MSTMNGMSSMASFNDIKYPPNVAISGRTSADLETDRWDQHRDRCVASRERQVGPAERQVGPAER